MVGTARMPHLSWVLHAGFGVPGSGGGGGGGEGASGASGSAGPANVRAPKDAPGTASKAPDGRFGKCGPTCCQRVHTQAWPYTKRCKQRP
eukprot:249054-Chlamydomonas_euryale.AAC.16